MTPAYLLRMFPQAQKVEAFFKALVDRSLAVFLEDDSKPLVSGYADNKFWTHCEKTKDGYRVVCFTQDDFNAHKNVLGFLAKDMTKCRQDKNENVLIAIPH